jgi:hypothetical protein
MTSIVPTACAAIVFFLDYVAPILTLFGGECLAVYGHIPRGEIIDALVHIRDLHRKITSSNERDLRAHERREAATRDLLSNLPRTNEHPTLKTLFEIADTCSLTLEGAHRLFGYDLGAIREYDLRLNGGRTHIFESYPFERDLLIDLPSQLAPGEAFGANALLRDLVPKWQTDIPIRTLEEEGWHKAGTFYVHIGTKDSLGSTIPPGAMALVEPVGTNEKTYPNPRSIYFLQFGNGYRCSHCVVTRGKLRLFSSERTYLGREEFAYPGSVRIVGRIRMFAVTLPIPEYSSQWSLPPCRPCADLILPWEHGTRDGLLATEHKRFRRSKEEELFVQDLLKMELNAKLSGRSERRYRRPTSSAPHVNALIHLTLAHVARYTDTLRAGGSWVSDRGRFSLETLLKARSLEEVRILDRKAHLPTPSNVWEARRKEFVEWPPLLSIQFPQLRLWDERVIRLTQGYAMNDLVPSIGPGTWMLLEKAPVIPDARSERRKSGWSRPIYAFRRGVEILLGHLEREGNQYALLSNALGGVTTLRADELPQLTRVAGIAVPV